MKPFILKPLLASLAPVLLQASTCSARTRPAARAAAPTHTASLQAPPQKKTVFTSHAPPLNARLIVPSIYLDALVMQGIGDDSLRLGPGHDLDSDLPGAQGNCVIAGHRNVWGAEFWHLPRLRAGDRIEIRTPSQRLLYRVKWARVVAGSDLSPLQPPEQPGTSRLTLYTCTKPRTEARFIVSADLEQRLPGTPALFERRTLPFPTFRAPTQR